MLIALKPGSPPSQAIDAVRVAAPDRTEIFGSPDRVSVYAGADLCLVSDNGVELLAELGRRGLTPELDPVGVSEFLHHGFVFAPRTVRRNVFELGQGDRLILSEGFGYGTTCEWPWTNASSRGDQIASTDRLLELLVASVQKSVGDHPATLMLSSGKDSVALALACREAGRTDVRALTFESDAGGEGENAARFAAQLGLEHRTVTLPVEASQVEEGLTRYFERATIPCGDPTLIPFLLAVGDLDLQKDEFIIDGLGNDSWMGYLPSRAEARGAARSDRWLAWLRPLRGLFSPESPVSAALRNRAEWNFFGGRWLHPSDTRGFYEASVDTTRHLQTLSDALRPLDDVDFRSLVRGRNADCNAMLQKARVTGETFDVRPSFPYLNEELAQYYFHLPEPDRFDRAGFTNKVLLRQLLREQLDYDDAKLGKRVFEFDGVGFLQRHHKFVLHEVTQCPLWNDRAGSLMADLLNRPGALRKTWPSLLALFQLSGWITRNAPEEDAA